MALEKLVQLFMQLPIQSRFDIQINLQIVLLPEAKYVLHLPVHD